jgi:hypothetical protein
MTTLDAERDAMWLWHAVPTWIESDAPVLHFLLTRRNVFFAAGNNNNARTYIATYTNMDPVDLDPIPALQDSYVHHSPLPPSAQKGSDENKEGWIMGIDEAGRGREYSHSFGEGELTASQRC